MKKILLAIDGLKINLKTLDFACHIGSLIKSNLTAVFLENLVAENKLLVKEGYDATYLNWGVDEGTPAHQAKMDLIQKNIKIFKIIVRTEKFHTMCFAKKERLQWK